MPGQVTILIFRKFKSKVDLLNGRQKPKESATGGTGDAPGVAGQAMEYYRWLHKKKFQ